MQRLRTETPAVQTILSTPLSGISLQVSIVVSMNSIVPSCDITSLQNRGDRIKGLIDFREEVGQLTESGKSPTDPGDRDHHVRDGRGIVVDTLAALTRSHVELGHLVRLLRLCARCGPGGPAAYFCRRVTRNRSRIALRGCRSPVFRRVQCRNPSRRRRPAPHTPRASRGPSSVRPARAPSPRPPPR